MRDWCAELLFVLIEYHTCQVAWLLRLCWARPPSVGGEPVLQHAANQDLNFVCNPSGTHEHARAGKLCYKDFWCIPRQMCLQPRRPNKFNCKFNPQKCKVRFFLGLYIMQSDACRSEEFS